MAIPNDHPPASAGGDAPSLQLAYAGPLRPDHVPYVPHVVERFERKSAVAYGPEEMPAYGSVRAEHYPEWSGYGWDLDPQERAACNAYHAERRRTRANEALTPGRSHRVRLLDVRDYKGDDVRSRPVPEEGFTMRVKNPYTKKYEWTRPTRWRDGQGIGVPAFVIHSNALSAQEKAILAVLWDCRSPWHWHVKGQAYVHGLKQEAIGAKMASENQRKREQRDGADSEREGMHESTVSRWVSSMQQKGFLKFYRGGDGNPGYYYLACQENGRWTYAALDPHSGRARIIKMKGHTKGPNEIDWQQALTTSWKPQSSAARRRKERDRAIARKKQERAAQRARSGASVSTGNGSAVGGALSTVAEHSDRDPEQLAQLIQEGFEEGKEHVREIERKRAERRKQFEAREKNEKMGLPPPDE